MHEIYIFTLILVHFIIVLDHYVFLKPLLFKELKEGKNVMVTKISFYFAKPFLFRKLILHSILQGQWVVNLLYPIGKASAHI